MFGFLKRRTKNAGATINIYFSPEGGDGITPENLVFDGNGLELHGYSNQFKKSALRVASGIPADQRGDLAKIRNQVAILALVNGGFPSIALTEVACYICEMLAEDDYNSGDMCEIKIENGVVKALFFSRVTMDAKHLEIEQDTKITRYL